MWMYIVFAVSLIFAMFSAFYWRRRCLRTEKWLKDDRHRIDVLVAGYEAIRLDCFDRIYPEIPWRRRTNTGRAFRLLIERVQDQFRSFMPPSKPERVAEFRGVIFNFAGQWIKNHPVRAEKLEPELPPTADEELADWHR